MDRRRLRSRRDRQQLRRRESESITQEERAEEKKGEEKLRWLRKRESRSGETCVTKLSG